MIMNKSLTYAVILFLSGVFLLNIMGLLIKHLELTYSPYQISVYRNIFGIIPIIIILFFSSEWKKNNYQLVFCRVQHGTMMTLCACSRQTVVVPCILLATLLNICEQS